MRLNRNDVTWFRPLWRRVLITALVLAWTIWEWVFNQDQFWGVLTTAILAYAAYTFFVAFPKDETDNGE